MDRRREIAVDDQHVAGRAEVGLEVGHRKAGVSLGDQESEKRLATRPQCFALESDPKPAGDLFLRGRGWGRQRRRRKERARVAWGHDRTLHQLRSAVSREKVRDQHVLASGHVVLQLEGSVFAALRVHVGESSQIATDDKEVQLTLVHLDETRHALTRVRVANDHRQS